MNTGFLTANPVATSILGLLSAGLVWATLAGVRLPLLTNDRAVLIVLGMAGLAMCGMGMQTGIYGWTRPAQLAGSVLGAVALLIVVLTVFGVRLPWIQSDRAAILALAGVMVVKLLIAVTRGFIG